MTNKIEIIKSVTTRVADVKLRSDGIIEHHLFDDILIESADILEIIEAIKTVKSEDKHPMLVLTGERNDASKEARELSIKNLKTNNFPLAEALVINSFPTRIATNFFYKIYKPEHPVKTFSNKKEAEEWLQQFIH